MAHAQDLDVVDCLRLNSVDQGEVAYSGAVADHFARLLHGYYWGPLVRQTKQMYGVNGNCILYVPPGWLVVPTHVYMRPADDTYLPSATHQYSIGTNPPTHNDWCSACYPWKGWPNLHSSSDYQYYAAQVMPDTFGTGVTPGRIQTVDGDVNGQNRLYIEKNAGNNFYFSVIILGLVFKKLRQTFEP